MEEKIICPICHSDKINFYSEKNKCQTYCCTICGLAFVYPISEDFKKIYGQDYFKNESGGSFGYSDYDRDKEPMRGVFVSYLKDIENKVEGRKIFDVGCATGYFLDIARDRGWQTGGMEISEYAAKEASERGHGIFFGNFSEEEIKGKFDVVTMWDVLEHLDNPLKYLKTANRILTEDGFLLINTINRESLWAKILNKRWHLFIPPEHLFYYTPKSLETLLKNNGFQIEKMKSAGKNFSLSYIFGTLYHWQKLKFWNNLSKIFDKPFWRKFSLPINLGDNILIIAKKIKNV
ncbi:MAG: class I SAM-dependent methyltransferase [Patescibacteria group bacterium]